MRGTVKRAPIYFYGEKSCLETRGQEPKKRGVRKKGGSGKIFTKEGCFRFQKETPPGERIIKLPTSDLNMV